MEMCPGLSGILCGCSGYCVEKRLEEWKQGSTSRFVIIQVRDDSDLKSDRRRC